MSINIIYTQHNCYETIVLISRDVLIIMVQVEKQVYYYNVRGNITRYIQFDVLFCLQRTSCYYKLNFARLII